MPERILCVDDEPSILDAFQRQLRRRFDLVTCAHAEEALTKINPAEPFAVVISDMRMPGMDGVRFLAKVHELSPDSVCIMLTGMADLQTAMNAVNEGRIFRFLTKPCDTELLYKSLGAAIMQYRLIIAEREVLEKTLKGCVLTLMDVLGMTSPLAFSRAMRLRAYAAHIASTMKLANPWQFEVAAMLSQLGSVTLPTDTLERHFAGTSLSPDETAMVAACPEAAAKLLTHIPRLEPVAAMIARQADVSTWTEGPPPDPVTLGAAILKAIIAFELAVSRGATPAVAMNQLWNASSKFATPVVGALESLPASPLGSVVRVVKVIELVNGMVISEDIRSVQGALVLPKGHEVNDVIRQRLRNCLVQGYIADAVRVLVPEYLSAGK